MTGTLDDLRTEIIEKKGLLNSAHSDIDSTTDALRVASREVLDLIRARTILQIVAEQTQHELSFRIAEPVTIAIASVLKDPYQFLVDFTPRRGQTECDLRYLKTSIKNARPIRPETASGGGATDIGAFALQFSILPLTGRRRIGILDEPLKWLKGGNYPELGALMIKKISEGMKTQIIMISHITDQIKGADKVIEFTNVDGVTQTKVLKEPQIVRRRRRK